MVRQHRGWEGRNKTERVTGAWKGSTGDEACAGPWESNETWEVAGMNKGSAGRKRPGGCLAGTGLRAPGRGRRPGRR